MTRNGFGLEYIYISRINTMKGYPAVGFFLPIWIPLHFGIAAFLVHILSFHLATLTLIKLNMGLNAPPIPLGKKTYKVNIFVNVYVMWGNFINWFLFVCIYCPGIPWIIIFYKYRGQYIDFTKSIFAGILFTVIVLSCIYCHADGKSQGPFPVYLLCPPRKALYTQATGKSSLKELPLFI